MRPFLLLGGILELLLSLGGFAISALLLARGDPESIFAAVLFVVAASFFLAHAWLTRIRIWLAARRRRRPTSTGPDETGSTPPA